MNSQKGDIWIRNRWILIAYFILLIKMLHSESNLIKNYEQVIKSLILAFWESLQWKSWCDRTNFPLFTLILGSHDTPPPSPSFVWFGQYLNSTTNYPIMGLCPYHFGLVDMWGAVGVPLFGFQCLYNEPRKGCPQKGTNLFVLVNISSWSVASDKFRRWRGGVCPKLTNLSSCPKPLRHRGTMPRQKSQKSRISFRLFSKVAFPNHIGGVTEPIFCTQIAPENQVYKYTYFLHTSRR